MKRKLPPPAPFPAQNFLLAAANETTAAFSATLKKLEKNFNMYPHLQPKDAEELYVGCRTLLHSTQKSGVHYNTVRLLKYAVTTDELLYSRAEELWTLIRSTLFDIDGNVRNAGIQLLSRYRFGMSCVVDLWPEHRKIGVAKQAIIERMEKLMVEQLLDLFRLEEQYLADHPEIVEEEESSSYFLRSWETKDKHLKTIRRAIEEDTRGTFIQKLAVRHGYKLPQHWILENIPPELDDTEITVSAVPLPPIRLHHFHRPGSADPPAILGITCGQCGAKDIHIGSVRDGYSAQPQYLCEECAITQYQLENGFPNREAAAARRRRIFDVGYLLHEMLIDWYLTGNGLPEIDDIDMETQNKLTDAAIAAYNLFPKNQKITLEETALQEDITAELKKLLPTAVAMWKMEGTGKLRR
ncbi:MAG: hypothetical protein WCG83_07080 [Candidatus Peregrinibacteria bacterium]